MNRREFMAMGAAGVAMASGAAGFGQGGFSPSAGARPKGRNRRPYTGVDWGKVTRVKTTSHGHCPSPWYLEQYLKRGFGLLTLSNYYPSAPWYPLSKITENYWRVRQDHPVMVNGRRMKGPFDWNRIIAPWRHMI